MMFTMACAVLVTVAPAKGREAALIADAADGRLDEVGFVEAALIASGVSDSELKTEHARLVAALAPAIERAKRSQHPRARAQALLRALHETVLRTYRYEATDLPQVITTGEFNCLSSAVLYVIAANELLPELKGMLTPRHAFVRMVVEKTAYDVETTSPDGFGVDRTLLISDELLARVAKPGEDKLQVAKELKDAEEVPPLSLIAGIYANRSANLIRLGARDAAASSLDRAARLASGKVRGRFAQWRASLVNTSALTLAENGQLAEAIALLELALEGTTGDTRLTLTSNLASLRYNQAIASANRLDWGAALAEAEEAKRLGFSKPALSTLTATAAGKVAAQRGDTSRCEVGAPNERALCLSSLALSLLDAGKQAEALQVARRAYAAAPSEGRAQEALFFTLEPVLALQSKQKACDAVVTIGQEMESLAKGFSAQAWSSRSQEANCWSRVGQGLAELHRWREAAVAFERAAAAMPKEPAFAKNLGAAEFNAGLVLAKEGKCAEAQSQVRRATHRGMLSSADVAEVMEACWAERVGVAATSKDWALAVTEARRGLSDVPGSKVLHQNLGAMLSNLGRAHALARQCDEVRVVVGELRAIGELEASEKLSGACR